MSIAPGPIGGGGEDGEKAPHPTPAPEFKPTVVPVPNPPQPYVTAGVARGTQAAGMMGVLVACLVAVVGGGVVF